MTTYYVGIGGNDGNTGLSWAQRFLTLNAAEDVPVVAGDTVYVGPGVYREQLDIDVTGGAGTPITYIGDVTGEHTDGVGGIVRITGSDDDEEYDAVGWRPYCVLADLTANHDYRTFRGFFMDSAIYDCIFAQPGEGTDHDHWIIEDCAFENADGAITLNIAAAGGHIIRRCVFMGGVNNGIFSIWSAALVEDSGDVIENCLFLGGNDAAWIGKVGGVTIRDCTFLYSVNRAVYASALGAQTLAVNNCIIAYGYIGLEASALGEILEDYNSVYGCYTDRTDVAVGAHSLDYVPLLLPPLMYSGICSPWKYGDLSKWSLLARETGTGATSVDLWGRTRPATASKKSWGAVQYQGPQRDATTTHSGSTASLRLSDAGRHQIWVPSSAASTTFSCYVYREANYAGTNPSMVIKQPGQADTTVTDAGAAGSWNLLTTTLTPAALPCYVVVELVSGNTAVAGNYAAYFEDLEVT